jgi:hypothetical protein
MEKIGDNKSFKEFMNDMYKKHKEHYKKYNISKDFFQGLNDEKDYDTRLRLKLYISEYMNQSTGLNIEKIYVNGDLKKAYRDYPIMDENGNLKSYVSTTFNKNEPDQKLFMVQGSKRVFELIDVENGEIKFKCLVPTNKKIDFTKQVKKSKENMTLPEEIFEGVK